ncbi:MAG: DNA double-strand break repair nuclease NurA [Dehalococcoidia bacterium]|nr:DNA double-strand break repair nuclease NurA [Dehalococcoidia bacterium]
MLDLTKVAAQANAAIDHLRDGQVDHQIRLDDVTNLLDKSSLDFETLRQKIETSGKKTPWLMAGLVGPPGERFPQPPTPPNHTVLATDGSHIDVDRHQSVRCYLINIGQVRLNYGDDASAELSNIPKLYAGKAEMYLSNGLHKQAVESTLLGIKRTLAEFSHLATMSGDVPPERSALALVDGSLILWGLASEKYPDFVSQELLENGYLQTMEEFRLLAEHRCIALASYISFPRSADVVNSLRLVRCPKVVADCDKHCKNTPSDIRPCEFVAGLQDSDLFGRLLNNNERSAVFYSQSRISGRYGQHRVHFYYLKLTDEIARVEVPQWVATDTEKLALTHALILDQCHRGNGYPVALAEAHEQAVVTGVDRASFQHMLEHWLIAERLPQTTSAKSQSKRTRWV